MKMVTLLANEDQSARLQERLRTAEFRMTRISSTGGFLRRRMDTLLLGVEEERLPALLELVRQVAVESGSALPYFILDVLRFERL